MKRLAALLLLLPELVATAQTGLLVPTSTGRPDPAVLSLREMSVDVGVARGYARVNIRQVFENHTGAIQEGTWRFALPPSGAVGDFAVWDGLTRIPGVILEKRRARAIYRDLTAQRIDPGLLQQGEEEDRGPDASGRAADRPSGGALFSVKVAPIPAWGTKRLELAYQHEIPWSGDVGELRVPLRPGDGEPMTAGTLEVRVSLLDGKSAAPVPSALPLSWKGAEATFTGTNVKLDKDIVVRFTPAATAPLVFSAFRNPGGSLPDGLALAPWERPSEIPPEKDGFFLLEFRPGQAASSAASTRANEKGNEKGAAPKRKPLTFAFLFDTSLSHRWAGLEAAYGTLVKLLDLLGPEDRFTIVAFDRVPAPDPAGPAPATPAARTSALEVLRSRPLAPGTDVAAAVKAGALLVAAAGLDARLVLLTDGAGPSGDLVTARSRVPLFTILTGEERREGYVVASASVLAVAPATLAAHDSAEESLFIEQLFAPAKKKEAAKGPVRAAVTNDLPFTVSGGEPKVLDVYAVMTQPPVAGSLSGWVGRYAAPVPSATLALNESPRPSVTAPFPETALEARDLPRRWARARVDDLLRRIELEGERQEWIDEILALSRRYKFVTPYTAFLAAPRSLLRPRRIQPGDPVIRVETDPGIVSVVALLPFGTRVDLVRRPRSNVWEGRFLVPEGLPDGRLAVRLVLRDVSGRAITETKHVVVDGTPPTIRPELPPRVSAGQPFRVAARADSDVISLVARLDDGPPIPLFWDPAGKRSTAQLAVPQGAIGRHEVFFEAADAAGNRGFAHAVLEVR